MGVLRSWRSAVEGEVDHHDRVLLHDADQQHDADDRDDRELGAADEEREDGAHPGRGQGREDRDRVDVALVEDPEDDVDRDQALRIRRGSLVSDPTKACGGALE